jgi:hypothetical protein
MPANCFLYVKSDMLYSMFRTTVILSAFIFLIVFTMVYLLQLIGVLPSDLNQFIGM